MLTLEQIAKETDALCEKELTIPSIDVQTKDYLAAYKENNLTVHATELNFQVKCDIATKMGFKKISDEDIVRMLTNDYKPKIKSTIDGTLGCSSQFYDPLFDKTFQAWFKARILKPGFWSKGDWEPIHMVPPSGLKCAIPYGVLLRMIEIQKLKFFNCLFAFAPEHLIREDCYTKLPKLDPIIVATLTKGHKLIQWANHKEIQLADSTQFVHFFIAKW